MDELFKYLQDETLDPFFINGDSLEALSYFPLSSIDCVFTSPPYYLKREYLGGGIGLEEDYHDYIDKLLSITKQIHRILKPTGSFWLNLGDTYLDKQLLDIPHRVAIRMEDEQGWILRNSIVWDKMKGAMQKQIDHLPNGYEMLFHFVKQKHGYYYDLDYARKTPKKAILKDGKLTTSTGVSGVRYKKNIEASKVLSPKQKQDALNALDNVLIKLKNGEIGDFRMIIKGEQRVTNGDSSLLSGRVKELEEKGFYFIFYSPKGSLISDVWHIVPEDTVGRKLHFAPFPMELALTPILMSTPEKGIVLDPFAGTGTTNLVSYLNKRKSIGIDICKEYLDLAKNRVEKLIKR